ncbi:DUF916 domain-containing protein [Lacticaseibacillus camelliae]|uniref:DUF916 domain-containing protein n=1 Tax=Lacticaseibacillus camelliae TaxID=381742 RepID=UPI000A816C6D|nr:DUF916 domain-containing protein [Lacticaseibacillus camelliae]
MALTFGLGLAQHQSVQAAGAEFSVTPVLGNDQINGVTDYFNLLVSPSQTRDLQVQVENTSKEAKTFVVTLTNAYSQSNGEIGYEPKDQDDVDPSLTAPLTSFSSKPKQEVKVAAGQTQTVTIPLKVPAAGFTGVKLGGIHVLDQSVSAPAEAGEGISLNNQFAMIIGVQLQTNADAVVTTQPDLKLGKVAAGTENNNASGGVIVTLRNVAPIYIDDLKATVEVTKKRRIQAAADPHRDPVVDGAKFQPAADAQHRKRARARRLRRQGERRHQRQGLGIQGPVHHQGPGGQKGEPGAGPDPEVKRPDKRLRQLGLVPGRRHGRGHCRIGRRYGVVVAPQPQAAGRVRLTIAFKHHEKKESPHSGFPFSVNHEVRSAPHRSGRPRVE